MVYKTHTLNKAAVDVISADVQDYLNNRKTESRNVQRIRLTMEEILLGILAHCGEGIVLSVGIGKHFGREIVRLRYESAPYDPTKSGDDPFTDDLLRQLGYSPAWNYRGKVNTVSLALADRQKRSSTFYILMAVFAAAVLGFAGNYLPAALRQGLCDGLLMPFANAFLGLITTFSGLMIAFTVCSGILGIGDSAATGRTVGAVLLRLIGISFTISIVTSFAALPFLHLNLNADSQSLFSGSNQIGALFFNIIPGNIIDPFREGNALQILVISILVGCALLAVGESGKHITDFVNEASALFQRTISMVCSLVPMFVFVLLLRQIWSEEIGVFLSFLKPIFLALGISLILAIILWLITAARLKCPPMLLIKKVLPPFLVALTTASSMSALTLAMETCEKKLGVRKSTVSFVYPLGSVLYMPASVVYFTVLALTCAEIYQVDVRFPWLVMAVIVSTLIVIALPPIPGAGMLGFTVLFSSLGIPLEALILATATNILFEFYDTGFNVMLLILQISCEAKTSGNLNRDILLKP